MFCLKSAAKIVVLFLLLSLASVAVIYFTLLTPQKRAIKHLDFIHQSVTEMHPAVLDASALDFQAWHKTAYESTKALLPSVHSVADERALLNYYFVGYKDSHMAGYLADSIYSLFERPTEQWTGWLMAETASGYEVIYSLGGDLYPEVGMQLISCDNQPIDKLLQSHYAPYIDMRWNLLIARDRVVKALTQQREGYDVLARPHISLCAFKHAAGKEVHFPLAWQPLDEAHKQRINSLNFKKYTFPSLTYKENNVAWVNVSDFKLESASAYKSHQQLLKDLSLLQGNETLVFDLRLNSGGNSGFGDEVLSAAFGKHGLAYLEAQLVEKFGASNSFYRSSWPFYWSRDYAIKQLMSSQGENSSQVKWLSAINKRLKKALENNEQHFSQQDALAGLMDEPVTAESASWNYQGKVIVITDKRCVSSCLNFVDLLKQIPSLHHWGEPTNADTVYTEVVEMWHDYHKDAYSFMVPVKQSTSRPRKDNEPYYPDVVFNGNIYDDEAVETWVLALDGLGK